MVSFFFDICRYAFSLASLLPVPAPPPLDLSAPSDYGRASQGSNTLPYQSATGPAPPSGNWQHGATGNHLQTTWIDGQQGSSDSQSFNVDTSDALRFPEEFDDFNVSLWSTNAFNVNPFTLQPEFPDAQFLALAQPYLDLAEVIEPQFISDNWVQPQPQPPAPVAAPILGPVIAPPSAPSNRVACSYGCGKTFRRAGDCRRHMKKHGPPGFICTLPGCNMPFYRADKLRDHLKRGHKINQ
jgi:hypothetical protein